MRIDGQIMDLEQTDTRTERTESAVEDAIVSGRLRPGAKLRIAELSAEFGVSTTPIREALSRLVSSGLVIAVGQRGFRVPAISSEDLADITLTWIAIESEALRRSIRFGDGKWEGEIVSALQQMKWIAGRTKILKSTPELRSVHKTFHANLTAACGSPRLIELATQLFNQARRYRSIMLANAIGAADFIVEHEKLADVVLARSSDAAVLTLTRHLQRTYLDIYGPMPDRFQLKK
jgi:DNA-binding GntR family transcriptional regulator